MNALERIVGIQRELGITAVFVDAKDDEMRRLHLTYGFDASPGDRPQLMMPIRDLRMVFAGGESRGVKGSVVSMPPGRCLGNKKYRTRV